MAVEVGHATTHSFVVKLWLEETVQEAGRALWRGHVTHVDGGERQYVQDLEDIPLFVAPYLEAMGVRLGLAWRTRRWLKRLNRSRRHPR